jgi:hypothetical protein
MNDSMDSRELEDLVLELKSEIDVAPISGFQIHETQQQNEGALGPEWLPILTAIVSSHLAVEVVKALAIISRSRGQGAAGWIKRMTNGLDEPADEWLTLDDLIDAVKIDAADQQIPEPVTYDKKELGRWPFIENAAIRKRKKAMGTEEIRERVTKVLKQNPEGNDSATTKAETYTRADAAIWFAAGLLIGHKGRVTSIAFSPRTDRDLLVSSSADRTAKMWEIARGRQLNIAVRNNPLSSAIISPGGGLWEPP